MDNIASIYIDVNLNTSKLQKDLLALESKKLKISVNDSSLTNLNKHLDLKVKHLNEVQKYFDSNPLTAKVNDSQLTELNKQLSNLKNQQININVSSNQPIFSNETQQLEEKLTKLFSKFNNFNPFRSIGTGFFENIGSSFSNELMGGIKKAAKSNFNFSIEDLVSKYATRKTSKYSRNVAKDLGLDDEELTPGSKTTKTRVKKSKVNQATTPDNFYTPPEINIPEINKEKELVNNIKSGRRIMTAAANKNFSRIITETLKIVEREMEKPKPDLNQAKAEFTKIRESFKQAYKSMGDALVKGDRNYAKAYAESIIKTSEQATADIDKIVKKLANSGVKSGFGSQLATMYGSTKGVITSRYVNPTKRTLTEINKSEEVDKFADVGKNVVGGLVKGLKDRSTIVRESSAVSFAVLDAMRKSLGIQSPSKKAFEIAQQIIAGLKGGLSSAIGGVKAVSQSVAEAALPNVQELRKKVNNFAPNLLPKTYAESKAALQEQLRILPKNAEMLGDLEGKLKRMVPDMLKNPSASVNKVFGKNGLFANGGLNLMEATPDMGSVKYFETLIDRYAKIAIKQSKKTFGGKEGATIAKEAGAMAATNFPIATAGALLAPLALPLAPTAMAANMAKSLLTPVVNQLKSALEVVTPVQLKLANLTGSEAGGKKELEYVKNLSGKYGTNIQSGAGQLSNLSFATRGSKLEGEETKRIFEGISAATRFVGASAGESSLIFQSFVQMIAKGKISMEELRQQLSEKFPPAMAVFAKAMGVSVPELGNLIQKGSVLAEDVLPKVADILINDFGKAANSGAGNFVMAINRMQNAAFDFSTKLVDNFGGAFTSVVNLGSGLFESFNAQFANIQKAFSIIVISLVAQTAVGFQTVLATPQLASKLVYVQNLFVASFRKTFSMITPFLAGTFIDLLDDVFGAKNSTFDNMSKGITNAITGAFAGIDNVVRGFTGKGLFSVSLDTKEIDKFKQFTDTVGGFFKIIPSGVVELAALVLMFQQLGLLAQTYIVPSLKNVGTSLLTMGGGIKNAVLNTGNLKDSFKNFFPLILQQAKGVGSALLGLASNALGALAVMAFAQSDFANPLQTAFNDVASGIKESLKEIGTGISGLGDISSKTGKVIKESLNLKSKGLELNPLKILGIADESASFKSDELFKKINQGSDIKTFSDAESKFVNKTKAKADSLGIGKYFSNQDRYLTEGQKQLLNSAEDIKSQGDGLRNAMDALKVSPVKASEFLNSKDLQFTVTNLEKIDNQIKDLGSKRSILGLENSSESKTKIKELDSQLNILTNKRKELAKPLTTVTSNVDEIKSALEEQEKVIENSNLPSSAKKSLKALLEPQKQMMEETVKIFKDAKLYELVKPLENIWTRVIDKLKDVEVEFEKLKDNLKIKELQEAKSIISNPNLNDGTKKRLTDTNSIKFQTQSRNSLESVVKLRENSLRELLSIQNAEGSDTRKEEIKTLREQIKKDRLELADSDLKLAQSSQSLIKETIEQTKQVQEYYKNISRNFQDTTIEISKLSLQTKNTQITNKLRESLSNGYETIIGTLVSGIEEALNSFTSAADKALDSQKDLLTTQFNIQDSTRSGQELSKTIPSIQVGLDFSSIPNDSNISQLKDEIDSTIGGTEELGNSINLSVNSASELAKGFESLINPLLENDKQTQEIFKNLTNSNDTTGKISDSTNQWNDSLRSVTPQVETINSGFNGLLDSLTNIFLKTNEWLAGLLKAPEIIGGIVNNVSQNAAFQGIQQIGNSILNANNPDVTYGKIIEPVDRKRFPITSGFGNRTIFGKADFHEGLDYGTPTGTPIKAPVSGRVTHAGALESAGIIVKIAGVDSQGRKTEDMLLHLSEAIVKVGDVVQQGQVVAKSGNTGRGTGAHLDWRRKVNGQYENPEVSLRTSAHLPERTQPIVQISKLSLQNSSVNSRSDTSASGITRGGNLLNQAESAKLTTLGKQLYALQQNPNILAFADTVARAEGTDFRNNSKNFGYSMMIGGEHDTDFSRHPFAGNQGSRIRAPRHNSTASGRFQMMDFNYSKIQAGRQFGKGANSDLASIFQGENPGSFSPAVQDLYFIASLKSRGILDKVLQGDFSGALQSKGIAQHYASLQSGSRKSAYGGQGTPEGQLKNTVPFAQQRLQARLRGDAKPLVLTPGLLQSQVASGTQLNIQSISQKSQATQENIEAQRKKDILNGETALNKVKRQTERVVRESQDKIQSNARSLTDSKFDSIPFPTTEQQNKKASTDILRKKQDTLKQFSRDLGDAKKAVEEADKFIKNSQQSLSGENDANIQKTLTVGIQEAKKLRKIKLAEIKDINSKIAEISKTFDAQESARFDKANFEEYLRSSKSAIELQSQENLALQEKITHLEKIKEISPTDPRVEQLPELKRYLAFNQLEVETAGKLLDIEEKIKKSGNDKKITSELQKQLVTLEAQNDAKVRTIELTNSQAILEEEKAKLLRSFEVRSKVADITNQFVEANLKTQQRNNSKNAFGIDTGELDKIRINFAQSQKVLADLDLEKNIQDIKEFGKRNGLASNQVNSLVDNFKSLNEVRLDNIKNELDDLINSDKLAEMQKVRENLQTQFNLIKQPGLDLKNARADKYERTGGNQFVANKMRRDSAKESEMFARDQALKSLDEQVLQARNSGINVTESEVANLRNSIVELSELKLDGLNSQFKDISSTLGDIAKQGLTTFSQGIADLITKGGSLEDVFDNLFNNILNSVINLGLNSLMGGLFGGGGFLGGLFYAGKLPKNYASGGVPIHPQSLNNALRRERMMSGRNAQIGIVHENELIIPASRTEDLAKMGLSPEMLLGRNFANGQIPSGVRNGLIDRGSENSAIQVKTQVINNVEYASLEQLQQGMQEAAKRGAEQGVKGIQMKMQNSSSFRNSVGI